MTQMDEQAGTPAGAERTEGLEVRIARQLLKQAKADGVSLVGPGGLLAGVTKTVLQAAPDAEMADHLGYEKVSGRRCRPAITATAPRPRRY
jgi:putative transposase